MRVLTMLCLCVVLAGCVPSKRSGNSDISSGDLDMFNKTFDGIVVDMAFGDYTRNDPQPWWSFSADKIPGTCLKIKVRNAEGKTRIFFDYSEDEKRIKELRGYHRDIARGASVVVDLGPVDENMTEERFDRITFSQL